jgi:hypothetical protein
VGCRPRQGVTVRNTSELRAIAMGGGERGVRGRLTSVRAWFGRWQGVSVAAKESLSLPLATACVACPATARPGRRGHPRRRRRGTAQVNRIKGPALSPDGRARVLGCTWVQGRRTRAASCANANAITARRRGHERHGAAYNGDKEKIS